MANESKPHTSEDISTEAQLWELNRMSDDLRTRLESMIEEQRVRVEAFTASQHSLSALPSIPQLQQPVAPTVPPAPVFYPQQPQMPVQPKKPAAATHAPAKERETPPPLPTAKRTTVPQPAYEWEEAFRDDDEFAPARPAKRQEKESPASHGWIITVGIFILIILLRSCE